MSTTPSAPKRQGRRRPARAPSARRTRAGVIRRRWLLRPLRRPPLRPLGAPAQLTLWYTGVFALLMLLFGAVLYFNFQASVSNTFEATLELRAQRIATGIADDNGSITITDVTGELPGVGVTTPTATSGAHKATPGATPCVDPDAAASKCDVTANGQDADDLAQQADVRLGALVRILDAHGRVVYSSPAFAALNPPAASVTSPLHGAAWLGIVEARDGERVQIYSMALYEHSSVFGVTQVGAPLAQVDESLRHVALELALATPFALALGALGSYWLARRAFRPIDRLTRVARSIEAGDLRRRVPVPRTSDEVARLALTFNEMIARLETSFTRQRRFVADASHELRTPVAVIRSVTDVALAQFEPREQTPGAPAPQADGAVAEYATALREVNAEAQRLTRLINDLLGLARADEGQVALEHTPLRLDTLARDAVGSVAPLAAERDQTITVTTQPVTVMGDETRLLQVVMNLLDNAMTYSDAGSAITVAVAPSQRDGIDVAQLTVTDTGIGVAPEHLPHLCERFYRADPARSRAAGGSGLGLAIADWIVKAHDGEIEVASVVGQGSTFTVTLPLADE